jgi:hypothetical protein
MLNKICTRMAKSAPYPPCTVTAFWLKYQDRDRMLRRVTQPPHIAGPLAQILTGVNELATRRYLYGFIVIKNFRFVYRELAFAHSISR